MLVPPTARHLADQHAVLLIDLENFFIGRSEHYYAQGGLNARPYRGEPFADDLENLLTFAQEQAGSRRLLIRRAYANFNAYHTATREYFLQGVPNTLMRFGVEPVQVFRFPGGGNKNAADMRLAMDATSLVAGGTHVSQFILVTGDADFIPLTLELKRYGMEVGIIGVTGRTNPIFERYCDNFLLFEELLAAREVGAAGADSADDLAEIRAALQQILSRSSPVKFAAVKPLLGKELNKPFDPTVFGCETTGVFLESHQKQLGIQIFRGPHDKMVELQGAPRAATAAPEEHTAALYLRLLKAGGGPGSTDRRTRFYVHPWNVFEAVTEAGFHVLRGAGSPTKPMSIGQFFEDVADLLNSQPVRVTEVQLKHLVYLIGWRFGEEETTDGGVTRYLRMPDDIQDGDNLRLWLLGAKLYLLRMRLEEQNLGGQVRPEVFVRMIFGEPPNRALTDAVTEMVNQLYSPPDLVQAGEDGRAAGGADGGVSVPTE